MDSRDARLVARNWRACRYGISPSAVEEMCYPFDRCADAVGGTVPVASFVRAVGLMGEKLTEAAEAEILAETEPFVDAAGRIRYRDYIVWHLKEEHAKSKPAKRAPMRKAPKSATKTSGRKTHTAKKADRLPNKEDETIAAALKADLGKARLKKVSNDDKSDRSAPKIEKELRCGGCGTVVPAGTPFERRKCHGCYVTGEWSSCPVTGCDCFPPRDEAEDEHRCRACLSEGDWDEDDDDFW